MGKARKPLVDEAVPDKSTQAAPAAKRTPTFTAAHGMRYRRQELIRSIEDQTNAQLICCVGGVASAIQRDDVLFFADLLHNIKRGEAIDLLLHTPGGDMDAAEKLVSMLNDAAATSKLRIIVPDFAKSAGTLMALGSDVIVMSDSSELGPIDPQIASEDRPGIAQFTAIQSYLDAFSQFSKAVNDDPTDHAARAMLDKFEPARVLQYQAAMTRARSLAEKLLKSRMYRDDNTYTAAANSLMDTRKYHSHGQMIGHVEASSLGLRVEYLSPDDPIWQDYWHLYLYQRIDLNERHKLFESRCVSMLDERG